MLATDKLHEPGSYFDNYLIPNIIFERMTRAEVFEKYIQLMDKTLDWDNFTDRMMGYIANISYEGALRRPPRSSGVMPNDLRTYIASLDDKVRQNVLKILSFCNDRAPLQLHNVVTQIVPHSLEVDNLPQTKATLRRQMKFEYELDLSTCVYQGRPNLLPLGGADQSKSSMHV